MPDWVSEVEASDARPTQGGLEAEVYARLSFAIVYAGLGEKDQAFAVARKGL